MSLFEATGPVKFQVVNESTAASNEVVAAVSGLKIRIIGFVLSPGAAAVLTWEDEDGNDLIGPIDLGPNATVVVPSHGAGYNETPTGKALHLLSRR